MSSVVETIASKKKAQPAPTTLVLPMLQKEHEGTCGDGCGCGEAGGEGGCCGG